MGATKELATYVVSAQLDAIPQDVRHEAHRALLNYVGCAVGGAREPAVDIALRALSPYAGSPTARVLGRSERLDPLQAAFIEHQAAQCGYCLNGMIMTAKALLLRNAHPTEAEILAALRYNLCRCGTHVEILAAVMAAAGHSHAAEVSDAAG